MAGTNLESARHEMSSPAFENVRVAVRVRPFVAKERLERQSTCLRVREADRQVLIGKDRAFTFDFVYGEGSSQAEVYAEACAPLVRGCMEGYNATVFAYGQTGSGKTYTMGSGDANGSGTMDEAEVAAAEAERRGVIPRVVDGLFDALAAKSDTTDCFVRVSYLEIYNEEVKDLLHPRTPSKSISIREDATGGIFVLGVQERTVSSREELFAALAAGSTWRATGSTLMNAVSSRSHSLFSLIVEQRPRAPGAERTCAKLHLVDLAGSERAKKTGAVGARFKESVTINQGLLALGNVIAALCDEGHKRGRKDSFHVPYRESKLTRLLQDSLGGNTQTLMVACVGPAADNMDESLNTLRYADRAKKIINKPVQNIEAPSIVDLRGEIAALQQQLQQQQSGVRFGGSNIHGIAAPAELERSAEAVPASPMPLSRGVLSALKSELHPSQLRRVLDSLTSADGENGVTPLASPMASPAVSPMASPARARDYEGATPGSGRRPSALMQLRHTMQQWGRAEAQRAQLLQRLGHKRSSADITSSPDDVTDPTAGSPASSELGALKRAFERGQLLQALGMQQLSSLESEMIGGSGGLSPVREVQEPPARPSSAPHAGATLDGATGDAEVGRLRTEMAARDEQNAALSTELAEARADLARDETIFAEKLQELRAVKKAHTALQEKHDRLAALAAAPAASKCAPTPPSAASTRSVPNSRSPASEGPEHSSVRLAHSPNTAFAEQLEADDDVLLDEAPAQPAAQPAGGEADAPAPTRSPSIPPEGAPRAGGAAEIEELQRSIRELNAEREVVQMNQRQLSSQVNQAAAVDDALSMDFEAQQEKYSASVRDLTLNIRLKEELIRELTRADEESRNVVTSYQHRLREMSERISSLQEELQSTKQEMEVAERQAGRSEEQKARLRNEYEKRLRETEGQLHEMRRRQKDQERALKSREAAERKLGELRGEVEKMRGQQDNLKETMKLSAQRYEQARTGREKELAQLRKQSDESARKVRKLEEANARQHAQLQRQADSNSRMRRERQQSRRVPVSVPATPSRATPSRAAAPPPSMSPAGGASGVMSKADEAEAREAAAELAAIEREEEALMRRKGAAEALEVELGRREAVLSEKEAVLASREAVQLKQLRTTMSLRHSIDGISTQLQQIDSRIEARRAEAEGDAGGEGEDVEVVRLLGERREAQERLAELEALGEQGGSELLDQAASSELRELEERLEDLTAQLEFKNSAIGELRESLGRMGGPRALAAGDDSALSQQISHMSLPIARRVLQAEVQRVLELRQSQRDAAQRLDAANVALQERDGELTSLRGALRSAASEHERQLQEMQGAHERQHAELEAQQRALHEQVNQLHLAQPASPPASKPHVGAGPHSGTNISPSSYSTTPEGGRESTANLAELLAEGRSPSREAIEALGKDNFYYKQSNKELRRKLREERSTAEQHAHELERARMRLTHDEAVQTKLHAELANLRSYLAAHPGATPTRVTTAALKEIAPDVLATRVSPRAAWPNPGLEPDHMAAAH